MNTLTIYIILIIVGILINIFMEKLVKIIFRRDTRLTRTPLRIIGIFLIINSILALFHING